MRIVHILAISLGVGVVVGAVTYIRSQPAPPQANREVHGWSPDQPPTAGYAPIAPTEFHAQGCGYSVDIRAWALSYEHDNLASPAWGDDPVDDDDWVHEPIRVITSMRVHWGSQRIWVPRSAYCDLADVREVAIAPAEGGCVIQMSGGDAARSWGASIVIRGDQVTQREVHCGEFWQEIFERTEYVCNLPDT